MHSEMMDFIKQKNNIEISLQNKHQCYHKYLGLFPYLGCSFKLGLVYIVCPQLNLCVCKHSLQNLKLDHYFHDVILQCPIVKPKYIFYNIKHMQHGCFLSPDSFVYCK